MSEPQPTTAPPRQLGFWMCLALVVGNMIGSGIFLLPASLAPYGLNSIFGWIFTAKNAKEPGSVGRFHRVDPGGSGPLQGQADDYEPTRRAEGGSFGDRGKPRVSHRK